MRKAILVNGLLALVLGCAPKQMGISSMAREYYIKLDCKVLAESWDGKRLLEKGDGYALGYRSRDGSLTLQYFEKNDRLRHEDIDQDGIGDFILEEKSEEGLIYHIWSSLKSKYNRFEYLIKFVKD